MSTYAPFAKPLYVMLKPVGAVCNLACDYCYYLEKSKLYQNNPKHVMSEELLEKFIEEYINSQTMPQVMFTWHGGETLMRPLSFYKKAMELQKKYAGTLIGDYICFFMEKNRPEKISKNLEENMKICEQMLAISKSFDLLERKMTVGGRACCFYFVDGFTKDEAMLKIMDSLYGIAEADMPATARQLVEDHLPYVEVELLARYEDLGKNLFAGVLCLFVDGYDCCIAIDCRTYPARGVEEPQKDKVLRGSRDGFVETLIFNTALIRRRIRDADFRVEIQNVGRASKTDVVLCYMDGRVDQQLLGEIRKRLQTVDVDALTMNQESLAECLYKRRWYNPFPKFKYTERPDTVSACILEGNIVVLVDNSPSAMVIPTSIFDIVEEADDYYFPPITGTYLRLSRFLIAIVTLIITPLFLKSEAKRS